MKELIEDMFFIHIKRIEGTLESCKNCIDKGDYEQAMVRLQMMGVQFTQFECDVISESTEQS